MRGFSHISSYCCLGTNFREWLNIQNRDPFPSGPSLINSWPRGLPHFPQRTFRAEGSTPGGMSTRPLLVSIFLVRESVRTGLEKAGQGVWCLYFSVLKKRPSAIYQIYHEKFYLEKRGWSHLLHTYIPALKLSLWISCFAQEQKDILKCFVWNLSEN